MVGQRQYWVVSPKADGKEKNVEEWKRIIINKHVAILGWSSDHRQNTNTMGPRFAKNVRPGDIILIARKNNSATDIVGFGVVKGKATSVHIGPSDGKVQKRCLDPFRHCEQVPKSIPLLAVLQHTRAFVQIHPDANADNKIVCNWMELKLKAQNISANGAARGTHNRQATVFRETDLPQSSTYDYTFKTRSQVKRARKIETELLSDYKQWLGKQGRRLSSVKFNRLQCDAWEKERGNLIEAKGTTSREDIRMAVGQLLDYAFQGEALFKQPNKAILLRNYPGDARIDWLVPLGIKIIWRSGESFVDNANGQFGETQTKGGAT